MDRLPDARFSSSSLAAAWRLWRGHAQDRSALEALPKIAVAARGFKTLRDPVDYRTSLLALIAQAQRRIYLATLYLQDDDAGRELLTALHAAKCTRPELDVAVFVDWHRAQRGLIGKARSAGNAAMYQAMAEQYGRGVRIYGVPAQRREFLGVMHLKGFVVDDQVLYSGASLNDVYLQRHGRYRLDRYHLIDSAALADSLVEFLQSTFVGDPAVHPLDAGRRPMSAALRNDIVRFRRRLAGRQYHFPAEKIRSGEVGVTPLMGLGARGNALNRSILQMILCTRRRLILFTPYFNLPGPIRRAINARIKAGCQVDVVLGDKTANDFYIPPEETFKTIGALPYLYEANLRRFCKFHQRDLDAARLRIHLWRHESNSFHLKGLLIDDDYALLTGNNMNPRAWRLDLENGLLIHDPQKHLRAQYETELAAILAHTQSLTHYTQLDDVAAYPPLVQRLMRRLARVRADRLINYML